MAAVTKKVIFGDNKSQSGQTMKVDRDRHSKNLNPWNHDVRYKTSRFSAAMFSLISRDLQPIFVQALKLSLQAVFVLALFGWTQSPPGFTRLKAKGQVRL